MLLLPQSAHACWNVGRLDYESEGLLLWTTDGTFSAVNWLVLFVCFFMCYHANQVITSPFYEMIKTYHVLVEDVKWPHRKTHFTKAVLTLMVGLVTAFL